MGYGRERMKSAGLVSVALARIEEAACVVRGRRAREISTQLFYIAEELVHLHRELLELPPERTPAACEFERADLNQDDVPF